MRQCHCSTPTQRIRLASTMIAHEGTYGRVSELSREHGLSRQSLYKLRTVGKRGMESVFSPKEQPSREQVRITRAVLTLLVEGHASREGIQKCLEELMGVHLSLGAISAIIHQAGQAAQEQLKRCLPAGKRALALDEQYGNERGKGYLNIVDVRSWVVVASIPPVAVDAESWTLLLWDLQEQGVQWDSMVSDGGKAIQCALEYVTPESIHQRDVWHVLHECQKVQGRIDRAVKELQEQTPKVERNANRVAAGQKPRGRNPKTDPLAHGHDVQRMEYIARSLKYLTCQLQRLLGVVVLKDQSILDSRERQEELDTLLELFFELCEEAPQSVKKEIEGLLRHVQGALAGLTGFCPALDSVQELAVSQLGEEACHLIGWAWLHRAILGPQAKQLAASFPPAWQPTVLTLLSAWDQAARASSAVENWHSILRPHLAVHRALTASVLAILALWHNHRVAPRGLHKGQSPLMRAGLAKKPTDWLVALGYPASSALQQQPCSIKASEPEIESIAA
ncbi:MAG TPA: transposase [Ktedonobacteraceae bacterium]|nr:transposase [Ktedonobacteraceae bacterium]